MSRNDIDASFTGVDSNNVKDVQDFQPPTLVSVKETSIASIAREQQPFDLAERKLFSEQDVHKHVTHTALQNKLKLYKVVSVSQDMPTSESNLLSSTTRISSQISNDIISTWKRDGLPADHDERILAKNSNSINSPDMLVIKLQVSYGYRGGEHSKSLHRSSGSRGKYLNARLNVSSAEVGTVNITRTNDRRKSVDLFNDKNSLKLLFDKKSFGGGTKLTDFDDVGLDRIKEIFVNSSDVEQVKNFDISRDNFAADKLEDEEDVQHFVQVASTTLKVAADNFARISNGDEFDKQDQARDDFGAIPNSEPFVPLPTKLSPDAINTDTLNGSGIFPDSRVSIPKSPGINVVSMSLYGSDVRYTVGALRNAEMIRRNFPEWTLRIYTESAALSPRYGLVPAVVIQSLRRLGAEIQYMMPEQDFIPPMMWRFLVADDLSVDRFIVRDTDSRLTARDAAAVAAWIRSGKPFHSIRDHPSHAAYAVSGGLWGGKTVELRDILRKSWVDVMRGLERDYFRDMSFLNEIIWPRVKQHSYCSDSVSCDRWPNSYPFPVKRRGSEHVGEVYDEHDVGRDIDIRIIRAAGENPRCLPDML